MTAKELIMSIPEKFNGAGIEDAVSKFHFLIDGEGGGDFTLDINKGECTVKEGASDEANCVVKAKSDTIKKVMAGDMNPQMAVFMGKLKISNLGEMMKYAKYFGLM